jgi:hypothetical protein
MKNFDHLRTFVRIAGLSSTVFALAGTASANMTSVTATNSTTGNRSQNTSSYTVRNTSDSRTSSLSFLDNYANLVANSGVNRVNGNTTADSAGSGDVSVAGGFVNDVNSGALAMPSMVDDNTTTIDTGNSETGNRSRNTNNTTVSNTVRNTTNNFATIDNNVRMNLNSGVNRSNGNTTLGNVSSGDVFAGITLTNSANSGASSAATMGSNSTTTIDAGNHTTGANSINTNSANVTNSTTTSVNNTARIDNNVSVNANSGHNTTSHNTTVGNAGSGNISLTFGATNTAN